jgi:hypothetical protein
MNTAKSTKICVCASSANKLMECVVNNSKKSCFSDSEKVQLNSKPGNSTTNIQILQEHIESNKQTCSAPCEVEKNVTDTTTPVHNSRSFASQERSTKTPNLDELSKKNVNEQLNENKSPQDNMKTHRSENSKNWQDYHPTHQDDDSKTGNHHTGKSIKIHTESETIENAENINISSQENTNSKNTIMETRSEQRNECNIGDGNQNEQPNECDGAKRKSRRDKQFPSYLSSNFLW